VPHFMAVRRTLEFWNNACLKFAAAIVRGKCDGERSTDISVLGFRSAFVGKTSRRRVSTLQPWLGSAQPKKGVPPDCHGVASLSRPTDRCVIYAGLEPQAWRS
jgi:hypothetical protein